MLQKIKSGSYNISNQSAYLKYIKQNKIKTKKINSELLVSIVIIGTNKIDKCLKQIKKLKYKNIEINLYKQNYKNYKTIDNLNEVKGDYILILKSECILDKNILNYFLNVSENKYDFIYCDNDMLDENNHRLEPQFKSDYSKDTLLSLNYIGSLAFIKKSIIKNINFESVYDLYLKIFDNNINVYHIDEVLYHEYFNKEDNNINKKLIENTLKRRDIKGEVIKSKNYDGFYIKYQIKNEKVSIIIPIKDNYDDTKRCLDSIYKLTTYKNFEIILVNNQSTDKKVIDLIKEYEKKYNNFKIIDADYKFNYSKINNDAVKKLKTDYVVFLNNDTKVITKNWIELMLGYASRPYIGAVGIKLLYDDDTIQHGGIVIVDSPKSVFTSVPKDVPLWGGRTSVPYNYSAVTAACMMVDINKFKTVKGFDEDLAVAYNDVDLCLKLLNQKFYNIYLPMVEMYHFESKTRGLELSKEKKDRLEKEKNIFYKKWNYKDKFYNKNYSQTRPFEIEIK